MIFFKRCFWFLVPENDNIMDNIIKLRERLGWKTEIPRHAMGCKDAMEKLKNLPDNEKVSKTMYFLKI